MKIIFWGTPEFAVPILDELHKSQHKIITIVSQIDKVRGRKKILQSPEVVQYGKDNDIPILQPVDLKDAKFVEQLQTLQPDIMIVVAYGCILSKKILKIPTYGCINVHFSLLPKYRGASPVNTAILEGDNETGVTIMKMVKKMDAGDILCQEKITITQQDTTGDLLKHLGQLAGKPLIKTIEKIQNNNITPIPQNESEVTYCGIIDKKDGIINWNQSAQYLQRFVRSTLPWPTAYSYLHQQNSPEKQEKITIHKVSVDNIENTNNISPGTVVQVDKKYIWVQTSNGTLRIEKLQKPGKSILTAQQFLAGTRICVGDIFKTITNSQI